MINQKGLYSVEYRDEDGDLVIKHALLTPKEAKDLIEEFARRGVSATVNLTGPVGDLADGPAGVGSSDDEPLLVGSDKGGDW